MILRYYIEEEKILVKEFLELKGLSRNLRKKARIEDIIYINGQKAKNFYELHKGDLLELVFSEDLNQEIEINNDLHLEILYEDEYIIIVNKPCGISSQPSPKHPIDNVISCMKHYFIKNNINSNVHLVNRLDFATSGLMIIAKDGITHFEFSKINILKKYLCEVENHILPIEGTIDLPIDRYEAPSIKRYVSKTGKRSITNYKVIKNKEKTDIVDITLVTGRTHQIRVHFSHLGHPLIGDELYGKKDEFLKLHCYYLSFEHPWDVNKKVEIKKYPTWVEEEICQE